MSGTPPDVGADLLQRVYGEYLEMPGLRLTCRQAQRLWGLEERTCLRLLDYLVEVNFLCRSAHGIYARLSDGRTSHASLRSLKARIRASSSRNEEAT